MLKYLVYKFGQFCVTRLPLAWSYRIAVFMSDVHYFFSFRDRRAVRNNLLVINPHEENLPWQVRNVFRNFGKYLVEFFRMAKEIDKNFIEERVRIEGLENIERVLKLGRGAVILTAHLGNWELGAAVLSTLGYPSMAIALPHKERPVNELFNQQRRSRGVEVVPPQYAIRRCLESLKQNKLVAVLADRDFSGNGKILNFFNRPTLIPKGAAVLAHRTGAPIIPMFFLRDENGKSFVIKTGEIIYPPEQEDSSSEEEILLSIMQKYTALIEDQIRLNPTQWLMFREFWVKNFKSSRRN